MDKRILTDCDGVLLDWQFAFDVWMSEHGYELIAGTEKLYLQTLRYGITDNEALDCIKAFNESGAVGFLPARGDSVEYVTKLAREGWRFEVISSLHIDKYAQKLRAKNLIHIFGDIFDKIDASLDFTQGKEEYLRTHYEDSGLHWVEDSATHAEAGIRVGLKSIIMDHEYNRHYAGVRANSWEEIYRIINDTTSRS
jgi:hypothetical protein